MNNEKYASTLLGALFCGAAAIVAGYSFIGGNMVIGIGAAIFSFVSFLYSIGGDT